MRSFILASGDRGWEAYQHGASIYAASGNNFMVRDLSRKAGQASAWESHKPHRVKLLYNHFYPTMT